MITVYGARFLLLSLILELSACSLIAGVQPEVRLESVYIADRTKVGTFAKMVEEGATDRLGLTIGVVTENAMKNQTALAQSAFCGESYRQNGLGSSYDIFEAGTSSASDGNTLYHYIILLDMRSRIDIWRRDHPNADMSSTPAFTIRPNYNLWRDKGDICIKVGSIPNTGFAYLAPLAYEVRVPRSLIEQAIASGPRALPDIKRHGP